VSTHLPRFFIEHAAAAGESVALPRDEAKHARVRRLAVGDSVALIDRAGGAYRARLESMSRAGIVVRIVEALPQRDAESPLALTLAAAVLKADRFDWVVEKATELGVAAIQPFIGTHTLARPSAARQARWHQIARSAAKQCGRSTVPRIAAPLDFAAVLSLPAAARLCFAEDGSGSALARVALDAPPSLLAIVGSEGGFSAAELSAARAAGCHLVTAGPRILRAETAAIVAVALCQARWGDLASLA
jgi:16S rRNA (uracil1498-N3)-methyltransferase